MAEILPAYIVHIWIGQARNTGFYSQKPVLLSRQYIYLFIFILTKYI